MLKLINSKRGVNDSSLMWGLLLIMLGIGLVMPSINASFGTSVGEFDASGLQKNFDADGSETNVNSLSHIESIARVFFWKFEGIPFWLNGILISMSVMLGFLVFKTVRSGAS